MAPRKSMQFLSLRKSVSNVKKSNENTFLHGISDFNSKISRRFSLRSTTKVRVFFFIFNLWSLVL